MMQNISVDLHEGILIFLVQEVTVASASENMLQEQLLFVSVLTRNQRGQIRSFTGADITDNCHWLHAVSVANMVKGADNI